MIFVLFKKFFSVIDIGTDIMNIIRREINEVLVHKQLMCLTSIIYHYGSFQNHFESGK